MHVMLIGDLGVSHTTGSHLVRALEANGHEVTAINERPEIWAGLGAERYLSPFDYDFVVWNSTPGYAPPETFKDQLKFLVRCEAVSVPIVGYHLDLYWGLHERERWVKERPFFRSTLLATADGGHQEQWETAGIDHVWFPPGVLGADCTPGVYREEYASDIAFVGSWTGAYHRESTHRMELVGFLKSRYPTQCKFWPKRGHDAVRGQDLNDLYASVKVVVGDSCMVPKLSRYFSDRVPETLGRGGYLVHPEVEGVLDGTLYTPAAHLETWPAGDWNLLRSEIEWALAHPTATHIIANCGRQHVLSNHSYEVRMRQLVDVLKERKLI